MIRFLLLLSFLTLSFFSFSQAFKIGEFQQTESFKKAPRKVINKIQVIGNKLTKEHIILRELTFHVGDTLSNDDLAENLTQSKKNILNTSLFNFAQLDVALIDSLHTVVLIQLTERWYIFPLPIFEIDDNNFNTWWKDKDFSRINYGMHLSHNNFRGRKEKLSITAKYGFTERYRTRYNIPYLNRKQKSGIRISFSYNRRDEISYNSFGNERLQYKDANQDALRNYSTNITYNYREKIFNSHSFSISYDYNSIVDSVRILNPDYLTNSKDKLKYFALTYQFTHDRRDSKNYPLKGRYFRASIRKTGLGIEDPIDLTNLNLEFKKYHPLSEKFFLAASLRALFTANNKQPHLLRNGLGYNSFSIRSYEYYVIDGHNIGLVKAQIKYQLVKPKIAHFGAISDKFGKFHYAFYIGIFSDAAYVEDQIGFPKNDLANQIQFGSGLGLDFVSYYDVVIRGEFSINKFGESGLFLHFVAPI
ncbi:MAG: BamA/TamA family outer membrane protein [Flavobacteriales bacterium]|nr:BamA/TamA family outer membrane protein [Flavobacteriales bacterium]